MKKTFTTALMAAALLASSCSDWTQTENLDFRKPAAAEQNSPEYRRYLEALRSYKQSEHRIMMMTVEGTSEAPTRQNQHPMAMPDSVDYICVANVIGLHPSVVREIGEVYAAKRTRTLCVVDYASIENVWKAMEDQKAEAGLPVGTTEDFAVYCRAQTELQLECCDRYGFAGAVISYLGRTQTELETTGQRTFMACVSAWRATHADKLMFVRGYIQNLEEHSILARCDYIVILCGSSVSSSQLTMEIRRKLGDGVPNDRFIMEVAIPTIADPTQVGATAAGAAGWVLEPEERFTKSGLSAANAQDDYFNKDRIYNNVRQAIAIMNPAPNN